MIKIMNVTSPQNWDNPIHTYRVSINSKFICKFDHVRSEGLAVCLEFASKAVKNANTEELHDFLTSVGYIPGSPPVSNPKNDKRRNNGKHITAKNKIITKNKTTKLEPPSITPEEVAILLEQVNK